LRLCGVAQRIRLLRLSLVKLRAVLAGLQATPILRYHLYHQQLLAQRTQQLLQPSAASTGASAAARPLRRTDVVDTPTPAADTKKQQSKAQKKQQKKQLKKQKGMVSASSAPTDTAPSPAPQTDTKAEPAPSPPPPPPPTIVVDQKAVAVAVPSGAFAPPLFDTLLRADILTQIDVSLRAASAATASSSAATALTTSSSSVAAAGK
jgi:hypothetical protein